MTIDFRGMTADRASAADVATVESTAASFERDVPVALLPVRLETRFAQVEVGGRGTEVESLVDALSALQAVIRGIADRSYATTLTGTVRQRTEQKRKDEVPLYAFVEGSIVTTHERCADIKETSGRPFTTAAAADEEALASVVTGIRQTFVDAKAALATFRSPYQRDRLTSLLDEYANEVEPLLTRVEGRILPGLTLARDLRVGKAAQLARTLGRDRLGRPLRAASVPHLNRPVDLAARVVLADGTRPQALGAQRAVPIDYAQLAESGAAANTIKTGVADLSPDDLLVAAASIAVLPGAQKAELLDLIETASRTRAGLDDVRAAIAAVPSDRRDLDRDVPARLRDVVFELSPDVHVEDRLQIRIYPEQLAVDTHEEQLTSTEMAAATAFWTATRASGSNQALLHGAWRALCAGRSTGRAAYIAEATTPHDPTPTPGAVAGQAIQRDLDILTKRIGELGRDVPIDSTKPVRASRRTTSAITKALETARQHLASAPPLPSFVSDALRERLNTLMAAVVRLVAAHVVGAKTWMKELARMRRALGLIVVEPEPEPDVIARTLKAASWSRAARSDVLPDRFVVVTVANGAVTHVAAGSFVPQDLKLSLDPDPANPDAEQFSLDEDGNLIVASAIRWMVDFDEALTKGMAISLPITPAEAVAGFDEVFVIGLSSGSAGNGAERLADMLDSHHYTSSGLELLPIGTATNNTEVASAGHSSADDPDAAFAVERGTSLVAADSHVDGQRFAVALGVDPERLAHVEGADGRDSAAALIANEALYAGTLGHALEELASGLVPSAVRDRLQAFVTAHVTGRGLVPSFRVADEPYGVLPTTAYTLFLPDASDSLPASASTSERDAQARFDAVLFGFLMQMQSDWTTLRGKFVKHAHGVEVDDKANFDAQAHFLAMLGLQATSVDSAYRFAVNVANRGGVRGRPDLSLSFGIPRADGSTVDAAALYGPFALMERFAEPLRLAHDLPADDPRDKGGVAAGWADFYKQLSDSRAYELRMLNGTKPLLGVIADDGTSAALTALLTSTAIDLTSQARQSPGDGTPLAEMLVRQALLAELRRAALRILIIEGVATDESYALAGSSTQYELSTIGSTTPIETSAWAVLFTPLNHFDQRFGISPGGFPGYLADRGMGEYLANRGDNALVHGFTGSSLHTAALDELSRHATAVQQLGQIPPELLNGLVREHLDVCSYRLDAWLTGLAQRRLASMRSARPRGVHIGAYGWIENLSPDDGRVVAATLPASLAGRPGRPVTVDLDKTDQGFIQTPSATHAVTAAILRSGFESQSKQTAVGNEMSVNLSSSRVRIALSLIDGVRAGNDLGALLGYRLERFLHEYYATVTPPVELDSLIGPLRLAYPTVATVDPDADAGKARERYVVDGLALVRTVLDWIAERIADHPPVAGDVRTVREILSDNGNYGGHPWGLRKEAVPPTTSVAKLDGLIRGIDALADALDAMGDLTMSEAVHQIVRGNHARASAVLAALAEGKAPPTPEIARTPRSGLPVSHRVLLQLAPQAADPVASPPGWESVPATPRSMLEPALNTWLAGLLPDPAMIRVRVAPRAASDSEPIGEVSVADLGLHPLDLLALLGPGFEAGLGELTARALDYRRPVNLEPDQPLPAPAPAPLDAYGVVPERAPAWGSEIRSIADVSSLLEAVHDLLARGRAATAVDFGIPQSAATGGGVDEADLTVRVERMHESAQDAATQLARLLADEATLDHAVLAGDPQKFVADHADVHLQDDAQLGRVLTDPDAFWGARETWRRAVVGAAQFGVKASPPRRYALRARVCNELLEAAQTAFIELVRRLQEVEKIEPGTGQSRARILTEVAQGLLGEGVALLPRFTLGAARDQLVTALAAKLVPPDDLDAWLEGAASVRDAARCFSDALVLSEALGVDVPRPSVAQLPWITGEPWLGGALPDPSTLSGRVSVVIYGADEIPAARDEAGVALFVDGWDELVPLRDETTGIALHYDQPDATAPQCVLLAVPPVRGQAWSLGDLVATLHDTLEVARNRTVELEHLGSDLYGQVLPLVIGELVPEAVLSDQEPAGSRVILDFAQNNKTTGA